jgi:hypothetical protein
MVHIDPLELLWIVVNGVDLVVTLDALRDAGRDRAAVRIRNGAARTLVAAGNVRREGFRVLAQLLLLALVVPGIFVDRPVPLSPFVVILIGVSLALLANTVGDRRERARLARIVEAEILAERIGKAP